MTYEQSMLFDIIREFPREWDHVVYFDGHCPELY